MDDIRLPRNKTILVRIVEAHTNVQAIALGMLMARRPELFPAGVLNAFCDIRCSASEEEDVWNDIKDVSRKASTPEDTSIHRPAALGCPSVTRPG